MNQVTNTISMIRENFKTLQAMESRFATELKINT